MDVMVTPKRNRRASMPARISSRRKSLFGHGIDSPEMSPETYSPPLTSPSSWSGSPTRTPVKTPIKSLQDGITQLNLDQTVEHRIGIITIQTTPTVNGVKPLSPDRGIVTPKTFYGRATSLDLNRNLYDAVKEKVRRTIVFAPRANQPFRIKKRSRSTDTGIKRRPAKTPRLLSPTSKPVFKVKKMKSAEKKVERPPKMEKKIEPKKTDSAKKADAKKPNKQVYNWQFFNSSTPTSKSMASLFKEKSSSVLTPPPSSKKRKKLISPYDMDHLKSADDSVMISDNSNDSEDVQPKVKRRPVVDFNKSATQVEIRHHSEAYGENIAEEIADDFSENEEEVEKEEIDVEDIIEELNKDVAEVLGGVTEAELIQGSQNQSDKLFPIFNMKGPRPIESHERTLDFKSGGGLLRAGRDNKQLILDVGQKNLREVVCSQCGLLYVKGDAVDEVHHQKYHSQYRGLLFQGWKNQRLTGIIGLDKIISVKGGDPKSWWHKVNDVLEIVDRELGFPEQTSLHPETQVFMYIKRNKIVGCTVAKPVRYAHRVLPSLGTDAALCSEETYPVLVGISRLWVHPEHRLSRIASSLVDSVRKNYNFVRYLKIDDIAFSSPTEDGRRFASKYCKRDDYLVYTYE
ncbi:N-acetyltransferase ESCO2 [Halyomorpha halys]|uniref:N-acetyltransferase ESCO2 n=1 Tax=Halyomorpha halys TaxID=286706 RepID=UPI0006D5103F|nr:N-acetyltransferase ESCO2 [Halyomorpha halys]